MTTSVISHDVKTVVGAVIVVEITAITGENIVYNSESHSNEENYVPLLDDVIQPETLENVRDDENVDEINEEDNTSDESTIQETVDASVSICKSNNINDHLDILRICQNKTVLGRKLDIVDDSDVLIGGTNTIMEETGQDDKLTEKEEESDNQYLDNETADTEEETGQDDKLTEKEQESDNQYLDNQTADTEGEGGLARELTGESKQECGKKKRKTRMADTQEKRELKEKEEQQCGKKKTKDNTEDRVASKRKPLYSQDLSTDKADRMAASRGYSGGWVHYDEQFRLRKVFSPFSSWGVVDMELWLLCVSTPNVSPSFNTGISNGNNHQSHSGNSSTSYTHLYSLGNSPINVDEVKKALKNYPHQEVARDLIQGLEAGFKLKYSGPRLPMDIDSKEMNGEKATIARDKIFKEINLGSKAIWFVGSSIVYWAQTNAKTRYGGPNIGLQSRGVYIRWFGKRGMLWNDFNAKVSHAVDKFSPPAMIIIQLGSNDLVKVKTLELIQNIERDILCLHLLLPNTRIVWSEVLMRRYWHGATDGKAIERSRKRVNSAINNYALNDGHCVIQHPNIRAREMNLYRYDGTHLSDIGYDTYLNNIQGGIETFLSSQKIRRFPEV
ncbi:unnamed protein product [Mytilus edulis]|uniref:SGNH hydrolase-type esterase domain-containing protein n=1 Tax=Mytilus edulis TaxID=6550 RepID=A0A8S3UBL4_MYTED|nr:unnamed protein product [Mytilus edulis]